MKKLNKLQINTERLMKDEELITLKGGYDGGGCEHMLCNCNGLPPNAWWGCYCSAYDMANAISQNCGGWGGGCTSAGPC